MPKARYIIGFDRIKKFLSTPDLSPNNKLDPITQLLVDETHALMKKDNVIVENILQISFSSELTDGVPTGDYSQLKGRVIITILQKNTRIHNAEIIVNV